MARPEATPEQREQIRRRMQEAAAEIYRVEGMSAISARAIAKKAGVSVGTIYAHFGNLTGLMQSLWKGHVGRLNAKFQELAAQNELPLDRLRALLTAYLEFGVKNAELYRGAFLFVRPSAQQKPDIEPLISADFPALLIDSIQKGQAFGDIIAGAPEMLAQILWSGVHGCLALPVNIDRLDLMPAEKLAPDMVSLLLDTISTSR